MELTKKDFYYIAEGRIAKKRVLLTIPWLTLTVIL